VSFYYAWLRPDREDEQIKTSALVHSAEFWDRLREYGNPRRAAQWREV
jgi:hypothetical protein